MSARRANVRAAAFPWSKKDFPQYSDDLSQHKNAAGVYEGIILGKNNTEYDFSAGWHRRRRAGWQKRSGNVIKDRKSLIGTDGIERTYYVYTRLNDQGKKVPDYSDSLYFRAHESDSKVFKDRMAEYNTAFEGKTLGAGIGDIKEGPEDGYANSHILKIRYVMTDYKRKVGIMEVTFWNNDVCLFFNVPDPVAGTLISIANTSTGGERRHVLGKTFWDLVRIRGQHTGAKLPFEYKNKSMSKYGMYTGVGGNVHHIKIALNDDEMIRNVFGDLQSFRNKYDLLGPIHPGEVVKVAVSYEDFMKYQEEMDRRKADIDKHFSHTDYMTKGSEGGVIESFDDKEKNPYNGINMDSLGVLSGDYSKAEFEQSIVDTHNALKKQPEKRDQILADFKDSYNFDYSENLYKRLKSPSAEPETETLKNESVLSTDANRAADVLLQRYNDFFKEGAPGDVYKKKLGEGLAPGMAKVETLKYFMDATPWYKDDPLAKYKEYATAMRDIVNFNTGELKDFALMPTKNKHFNKLLRLTTGESLNEHDKKLYKGAVARQHIGRPWTKEQLISLLDKTGEEGLLVKHREAYRHFISNGDFQGAIDMLQRAKRPIYNEHNQLIGEIPYIDPSDYLKEY